MDAHDTNKLNALLKRRQQLASIANSHRKLIRSYPEGIASQQTKTTKKNESDIIENSDSDTDFHLQNDFVHTSTFSLPLTHSYFSPEKLIKNPENKINIISNILLNSPLFNDGAEKNAMADTFASPLDASFPSLDDSQVISNAGVVNNAIPETSETPLDDSAFPLDDGQLLPVAGAVKIPIAETSATHMDDSTAPVAGAVKIPIAETSATHMDDSAFPLDDGQLLPVAGAVKIPIAETSATHMDDSTAPVAGAVKIPIAETSATHMDDPTAPLDDGQLLPVVGVVKNAIPETSETPLDVFAASLDDSQPLLIAGTVKNSIAESSATPLDDSAAPLDDTQPLFVAGANKPIAVKRKIERVSYKKFLDFLSDEEKDFSGGSSDLWTNDESNYSSEDSTKQKKKKLKKVTKSKENKTVIQKKEKRPNKEKIRKKLKTHGKSYTTRKGKDIPEKTMKANPCSEGKCVRKCYEISEERRASLFEHFYRLDIQRRRDWILRCSRCVPVKRKRTKTTESRRSNTYEYYINDGEDHRTVCQQFLLETLDISQKFLLYTLQNATDDMAMKDMRKSNVPIMYTEESKTYVRTFILKIPTMPSHYSRKRTNKMYLSQEFKNVSSVFRFYLEDCSKNEKQAVSESIFRKIFSEYNIGIHVPKKDKCVICTHKENNNAVNELQFQNHLEEKHATYKRFKAHQQITKLKKDNTIVTSFDLQKVLNTPHGESMLLYYSRKYTVYNFTLYESNTQDAFCFTWGESDGKRGSNEIATCLLKYLKHVDEKGIKYILLYCDSCGGQNKNKTVLAALNYFLKTAVNVEIIQINYLLPGHTYMPVDSVHAVIEREVKRLIVWSPSQWPSFFLSARKRPRPYHVEVLDHTDFLNFEDVSNYSFTPALLKILKIKDIRTVTFKKKNPNIMYVKYSMKDDVQEINFMLCAKGTGNDKGKGKGKGKGRGKGKVKGDEVGQKKDNENVESSMICKERQINVKPLYLKKIPLSLPKYKDLMQLCNNGTIPKIYHEEYRRLPSDKKVLDILAETDDEDEEGEYE